MTCVLFTQVQAVMCEVAIGDVAGPMLLVATVSKEATVSHARGVCTPAVAFSGSFFQRLSHQLLQARVLLCCCAADPITYHYDLRLRNGLESMAACDKLMANLSKVSVPFIVFHSEKDTLSDPKGSTELLTQAKVGTAGS